MYFNSRQRFLLATLSKWKKKKVQTTNRQKQQELPSCSPSPYLDGNKPVQKLQTNANIIKACKPEKKKKTEQNAMPQIII